MNSHEQSSAPVVEVRPEVVFLSELLQELVAGMLRIPRFQRPFVWRRDQMTDLLDSVYFQYPIGSLLVWESDIEVSTLETLGPFHFPLNISGRVGYILDGHQRLSTLAGALVPRTEEIRADIDDPLRWDLVWNMEQERFQHGDASSAPGVLFPLTSLLDTLRFFNAIDDVRSALAAAPFGTAERYMEQVTQLARSFQQYRVPVIRLRQTGLSEAVEIFARLNSKGQVMSADQMVSALTYRQATGQGGFDLAQEIDGLSSQLGEQGFGDVDRTTILRAILASINEDIYKTDWTRLAAGRRSDVFKGLPEGVERSRESLDLAVSFLKEIGVPAGRLLPYTMQLALLASYFDAQNSPTGEQVNFLRRWFWVSSFAGWFGGANPSRVNALITEFRDVVANQVPLTLENFDLGSTSLPFPTSFDMRSARTRTLLLVMLRLKPRYPDGTLIQEPWRPIVEHGPDGVGYVFGTLPRHLMGNPANRMIRPPGFPRGQLRPWIEQNLLNAPADILLSHGLNDVALEAITEGDAEGFVRARQQLLIEKERQLQEEVGVQPSGILEASAPIDTEYS